MAQLRPVKTWDTTRNQAVANDATIIHGGTDIPNTHKLLLIGVYADMIANGWTVEGSSDGVTAAMDGVNRLLTSTNLRFGSPVGNTHSWIVLKQTGTGMYALWNHEYTNDGGSKHNMELYISRNAFTGSSLTARPTSTEEAFVRRGEAPSGLLDKWHRGLSNEDWRWHHWHTSDAKVTMVACFQSGTLRSWWYFGDMRFPQDNWAQPWTISMAPGNTNSTDFFDFNACWADPEFQAIYGPDQIFSSGSFAFCTTHMIDNDAGAGVMPIFRQITAINPTSNKIDVFPAGLFQTADGVYGHMGYYFDMWWSGVGVTGDIHEDADGNKWVKIGPEGVFVPWHPSDAFLTS